MTIRRAVLSIACALFAACWLLAVIGISRDMRLPINERWAASAMLVLEGTIAVLWIAVAADWRRAFTFALVVLPTACAIELLGVTSGLVFGQYHYTDALLPRIFGRVPAPITCAWLMIALGSLMAARAYAPRARRGVTVIIAAALATGLDACLEPSAFHLKQYWLWDQTGPYYGVPLRNFVGWFFTALFITACAAAVLSKVLLITSRRSTAIPNALFWSTVVMFAVIDFFRGYPGGALIGGLLCLTALPAVMLSSTRPRGTTPGSSVPSTPERRARATAPNSPE